MRKKHIRAADCGAQRLAKPRLNSERRLFPWRGLFHDELSIVYSDGLVVMTRLGSSGQFELYDSTYSLFRIRHGSDSRFEICR